MHIRAYHLRTLFFWRWWTVIRLLVRGVRVHPSAMLNGQFGALLFSRGVKIGSRVRMLISEKGEIELAEGVWLSHDVELETAGRVAIGAGTTVQRRASINGSVTIGNGCIIAPNVFISSGTHPFREFPDKPIREQERMLREKYGNLSSLDRSVTIGNDCWLGVNVVICPGVTVGDGCVIGANSVVVKDIPPYTVAAGVPAKAIGKRD